MRQLADLPAWAQELLDDISVGHLGFHDEHGHPRVQPITFVRLDDALWTAIDEKPKRTTPARIARLQNDPRATLTVDRYDDDWTQLAWVQVLGTRRRSSTSATTSSKRSPPAIRSTAPSRRPGR